MPRRILPPKLPPASITTQNLRDAALFLDRAKWSSASGTILSDAIGATKVALLTALRLSVARDARK